MPAAGDTKTKIDVRTPGVNASDSMQRRVMDTTAFDGVFGVELQKDNVSFGLGYNVQASEHQTGQGGDGILHVEVLSPLEKDFSSKGIHE